MFLLLITVLLFDLLLFNCNIFRDRGVKIPRTRLSSCNPSGVLAGLMTPRSSRGDYYNSITASFLHPDVY